MVPSFMFITVLINLMTQTLEGTLDIFPMDRVSPYEEGWHGSVKSRRDIAQCQHVSWNESTYEKYDLSLVVPESTVMRYNLHRYEDTVTSEQESGFSVHRSKYLLGSIAYVEDPYYTMSVLEPYEPGGCTERYFRTARSTVSSTSHRRFNGCKLAINAGYFSMTTGKCLGNVVSDGRLVQASKELNANFGIRQDGSIVVGYVPEEEILDGSYRQLISGVVWLVRNGTNYVNESMQLECPSHQQTGKMFTFVNVVSARTAVGHDRQGRVVIAHIEGQTHRRGANLYEFADLLVAHGVVNAINLDGGGSSTFIHNQVLVNYPSDHCSDEPAYRCERPVSTILCFHDVQCLEPSCSGHGKCFHGRCTCNLPWIGNECNLLNCSLENCSNHGNCTDGVCMCDSGWTGATCDKACSSGYYGPGCISKCWCYGKSLCDAVSGACICPPGLTGKGCWRECDATFYGPNCTFRCPYHNCSDHGKCSSVDGSCLCSGNWTGILCNEMVQNWNATPSINKNLIIASQINCSDELASPTNFIHSSEVQELSHTKHLLSSEAIISLTHNLNVDDQLVSRNCKNYGLAIFVLCLVTSASVIVHLFICIRLNNNKKYNLQLYTYDSPTPTKRRHRKRTFVVPDLDTSSDCSI